MRDMVTWTTRHWLLSTVTVVFALNPLPVTFNKLPPPVVLLIGLADSALSSKVICAFEFIVAKPLSWTLTSNEWVPSELIPAEQIKVVSFELVIWHGTVPILTVLRLGVDSNPEPVITIADSDVVSIELTIGVDEFK